MARGVTQQDVDAAADAVLFGGEQPTVERVRIRMGRGSPNTVGPLLKDWFRRLPTRIQNPPASLPAIAAPDVPLAVLNSAKLIWDTARKEAQAAAAAELAGEREQLDQVRQELQQKEAALEASRVAQEESVRLAHAQIEDQRGQITDLAARLQQAEARETGLQEAARRLEDALAQERQRAEQTGREHEQQRRQDADRAAANERRHLQEIDRARTETVRVQEQLAESQAAHRATAQKLESTREAAHARQAELSEEVAERDRQLAQKELHLSDALAQVAQARDAAAASQRVAAAHEAQANSVGQALAAALATQEDLRGEVGRLRQNLVQLQARQITAAALEAAVDRLVKAVDGYRSRSDGKNEAALRELIAGELKGALPMLVTEN